MTTQQSAVLGPILLASVLATLSTTGCGSSGVNRVLESIQVTPASADAQTFANGDVQFTATGKFSRPPSPAPVTFTAPYSGSWLVSDPTIASITQNGVAQCAPGASGIVTVTAIASTNSCHSTGCTSTAVSGTAKLTCP